MAIGGSSPRAWYVLLKDRHFRRDNTEVVILGINTESIQAYVKANRPDLQIAKTRLKSCPGVDDRGHLSRARKLAGGVRRE